MSYCQPIKRDESMEVEKMLTHIMTLEAFLALPETSQIEELIEGAYTVTTPDLDHQRVVRDVLVYLQTSVGQAGEFFPAPTGVLLSDHNFVEPDLLWVASGSERCRPEANGRYLEGPPDFVLEVLSPSTARRDRVVKFSLYEQNGVSEYWIVEPKNRLVEVWVLTDGVYALHAMVGVGDVWVSPLFNFTLEVDKVFPS